MLGLTGHSIRSRLGGTFGGFGGRDLLHRTDVALRKDLKLVRGSEVALSSFVFGVLQGRFKSQGGLTLGLPVDLVAGGLLHFVGCMPFARQYSHHLHALGDGAIAAFTSTMGYRVGERWEKGGLMKGLAGMFGDDTGREPTGGSTIADKELSNLVRAGG